jgi:hypothetical protein
LKPEQIYKELIDLAGKFGITVKEENLRKAGIHVNSGLCTVKGKKYFIMDKHKKLKEKMEILSECLSEMNHENIFVIPAVRDYLSNTMIFKYTHHEQEKAIT